MKKGIGDEARLKHILDAISEIEKYIIGFSVESFLKDSKTHFATIKQLEIIGEAANRISPNLLKEFSGIEWRAIQGFRNVLIHEYFNVRLEDVWQTIFEDLPALKETVQKMLQKLS